MKLIIVAEVQIKPRFPLAVMTNPHSRSSMALSESSSVNVLCQCRRPAGSSVPTRGSEKRVRRGRGSACFPFFFYLSFPFSFSSSLHSALRVSEVLHRAAGLHPVRGGLRRPAHHHHLAQRRPAHPSQPRGDHRQHRLHQLPADLQPLPAAQRELHLHRPQRGGGRGAPEPAHRER